MRSQSQRPSAARRGQNASTPGEAGLRGLFSGSIRTVDGRDIERGEQAVALVRRRRRIALAHRRCPTEETRAALAAIDEALAEYNINIPAVEQARRSR